MLRLGASGRERSITQEPHAAKNSATWASGRHPITRSCQESRWRCRRASLRYSTFPPLPDFLACLREISPRGTARVTNFVSGRISGGLFVFLVALEKRYIDRELQSDHEDVAKAVGPKGIRELIGIHNVVNVG